MSGSIHTMSQPEQPPNGKHEADEHDPRVLLSQIRSALDGVRDLREEVGEVSERLASLDTLIRDELVAEAKERRAEAAEERAQAMHWRGVVLTGITESCSTIKHGVDRVTQGRAPELYAVAALVVVVGITGLGLRYGDLVIGAVTEMAAGASSDDQAAAGAGVSAEPSR